MNKLILNKLFLISILSIIFSCNQTNKESENINNLKILIRTNNDCTNILMLDNKGKGKLTRGIGNPYRDEFTEVKNVEETVDFSIKTNDDILFINKAIDSIANEKLFKQGYLNDAPHYELHINGEKKIDIYGAKSDVFHSILKKVWKSLPKEINYYCQ